MSKISSALKRKGVWFSLDKVGGAIVLREMVKPTVDNVNNAMVRRANQLSSSLSHTTGGIGAPNKRGGVRYYGQAVADNMNSTHAINFVAKHGDAIKSAGRKALK